MSPWRCRGVAVAHEHAGCGKLAVGVAEDPRPSRFVCSAPLERTGTRVSRAKPHLFAPHPRRHAATERKLVSLRAPAIDARGIPDARGAGGADRIVRKAKTQRSVGGPRRRRAQTETAAQTFHSRGLPFVFVGHRVVGAGASHTGVTLARPHVEARAVRGLRRRGWTGRRGKLGTLGPARRSSRVSAGHCNKAGCIPASASRT